MKSIFTVDQRPFYVLGGQVHNSSAYHVDDMEASWNAIDLLRVNTIEVPIYWEKIEPIENDYRFDDLDWLIINARIRNLHIILLWFGSWKNGSMQYAPGWVKADPNRFQRVINQVGAPLWVLSSHSEENWQADSKAFCALLEHLKNRDADEHTVIAIQIENEPGILGAVRDHSAMAEKEFKQPVPEDFLIKTKSNRRSLIHATWKRNGSHRGGNWERFFGENASEYFSAWSIAHYIDRLAQIGKTIYQLPMYVNAWLGENSWRLPGDSYPSGGPVSTVLDIWKWNSSSIDLIAPDIYPETPDLFRQVCWNYERSDNLLFIPESGHSMANALNIFEAIADFHAIGYAVFGIESMLLPDGTPKPECIPLIESFQSIASILPLLNQYQGTGKIHSVIQREFLHEQLLDLGDYLGLARFISAKSREFLDFRHNTPRQEPRGRGLIIVASPREFYLSGVDFRFYFRKKESEAITFSKSHDHFDAPMTPYLSVEEGHLSTEGEWFCDRIRNGDEISNGIWLAPGVGVVRVKLTD